MPDDLQEPFPQSGLAALICAAAIEGPDAVLFRDDDGESTAAQIAERIRRCAAHFEALGLRPGDRVLIVAGAQTAAIVALAATLLAGAEPALVPCGLGPIDLSAHARTAGAVALVGPSRYGTMPLDDIYFSTAALVDTIRLVATQGPEAVDGAVDLSAAGLAAATRGMPPLERLHEPPAETVTIATFQGAAGSLTLVLHRQAALFADALSLVEHARINPSKRLISTLSIASLAGLVAGPFAALVGASSLSLHGPFDAKGFLAACDAESGAHIVVPYELGPAFENKSLTSDVTSLVLVSRFADQHAFALPPPLDCDRPIVDLYAFGEDTLLARRRTDGEARPPARITDKRPDGGLGARLNRAQAHDGHDGPRASEGS